MKRTQAILASLIPVAPLLALGCFAPRPPPPAPAETPALPAGVLPQTDADEYACYELLAPESGEFHVRYEVSATTPGALAYFNPLRAGSWVRDERAYDLFTGEELVLQTVDAEAARVSGHPLAQPGANYLKIDLARPVPVGGEVRLCIEKVYKDPRGWFPEGDHAVFARIFNIGRNAVVLPAGHELLSCNFPVQVITEPDGRLRASFIKPGDSPVFLVLKCRRLPDEPSDAAAAEPEEAGAPRARSGRAASASFSERAREDGEVVFELMDPATHSFRTYRDFTESTPGADHHVYVLSEGSRLADPVAWLLDTGEALPTERFAGAEALAAGIVRSGEVDGEQEVVVVRFPPVEAGRSVRVRIGETLTDDVRYQIDGGELAWSQSFSQPLNSVILPTGWHVTSCSAPAMVQETTDGRIRLSYVNPRPDSTAVVIRARPRPAAPVAGD